MNRIVQVKPLDNYELLITFSNGEKRKKDMKPYLEKGVFQKLKNKEFFDSVKVSFGTVSWNDGIDLDPDNVYESSEVCEN